MQSIHAKDYGGMMIKERRTESEIEYDEKCKIEKASLRKSRLKASKCLENLVPVGTRLKINLKHLPKKLSEKLISMRDDSINQQWFLKSTRNKSGCNVIYPIYAFCQEDGYAQLSIIDFYGDRCNPPEDDEKIIKLAKNLEQIIVRANIHKIALIGKNAYELGLNPLTLLRKLETKYSVSWAMIDIKKIGIIENCFDALKETIYIQFELDSNGFRWSAHN